MAAIGKAHPCHRAGVPARYRQPEYRSAAAGALSQGAARIIVGARNFGCGSSRESAVYALMDAGIRCVIAPSFGDILFANAVQNGLLAATVCEEDASTLMQILNDGSALPLSVDLEQRTITCGNRVFAFTIDDVSRARLLNGWDDIGLTKNCREAIEAFKADDRLRRPWAYPSPACGGPQGQGNRI